MKKKIHGCEISIFKQINVESFIKVLKISCICIPKHSGGTQSITKDRYKYVFVDQTTKRGKLYNPTNHKKKFKSQNLVKSFSLYSLLSNIVNPKQ